MRRMFNVWKNVNRPLSCTDKYMHKRNEVKDVNLPRSLLSSSFEQRLHLLPPFNNWVFLHKTTTLHFSSDHHFPDTMQPNRFHLCLCVFLTGFLTIRTGKTTCDHRSNHRMNLRLTRNETGLLLRQLVCLSSHEHTDFVSGFHRSGDVHTYSCRFCSDQSDYVRNRTERKTRHPLHRCLQRGLYPPESFPPSSPLF